MLWSLDEISKMCHYEDLLFFLVVLKKGKLIFFLFDKVLESVGGDVLLVIHRLDAMAFAVAK